MINSMTYCLFLSRAGPGVELARRPPPSCEISKNLTEEGEGGYPLAGEEGPGG